MSKIAGHICGILLIIGIIVWIFAFVFGGVEILWWIFTGDFLHFTSGGTAAFY